jgi:nitroimidazol reductase NimA-like FMN-containing flavoprotein (pyridoxamine 5'-phosphate oxidase superfamily)
VPRLSPSARTRVRRHADRALTTREDLYEVLDAGLVAHVAFIDDGHPVVLPMGYARDGDTVLLHGSVKNHMLRAVAQDANLCVSVTLVDGLVLGRTAFTHSMNYRSAVIYGRAEEITEPEAKARALDRFVEFMLPGRTAQLPAHTRQELAATIVIAIPITEASVKARSGPPRLVAQREGTDPWTGVIPIRLAREDATPAQPTGSASAAPSAPKPPVARSASSAA